ncbi:Flp pilus assembly complex ATPase component TadA [Planctomycetota bacterium]|nr:Flp pilus assembly complex ATPase component TadA [Planctomycetota bacterium]
MSQILEHLLNDNVIDVHQSRDIKNKAEQGVSLDQALIDYFDNDTATLNEISTAFRIPFDDLKDYQPDAELISNCPASTLITHQILPLRIEKRILYVATSKFTDRRGLDELQMVLGYACKPVLSFASEINRLLTHTLGVGADTVQSLITDAGNDESITVIQDDNDSDIDLSDAAGDASIIKFVNQILAEAIKVRATDVHFEPYEKELVVRYRIDGVLQYAQIPAEIKRFQPAIVSRLKILSHLDIAEKRLPQDGRIRLKIHGREIDVRVSVIPMLYGEAVVLRILDRNTALRGLSELGIDGSDLKLIDQVLELPHGIVLVTGPTGSGKTTTLYAALSQINNEDRKIITIEDPIEYQLQGVNQIQVAKRAGLTFAKGLRAILRHDPDIVLIGEIRDGETAQIAVQASLTGHMVFSTLHTNDAPSALTRLVDMGVEPYLVASSLEAILAQRLVRVICPDCKEQYLLKDRDAWSERLKIDMPRQLYRGAGCQKCQGSGYKGRTVICEFMHVNDAVRRMILENASASELRIIAESSGLKSLRTDGFRHVLNGRTTLEEVLRVTKDERDLIQMSAEAVTK